MPKPARFTLIWSEERKLYELYENGHLLLQTHGAPWFVWLTTHTSFSFHGKDSHFNLLKETPRRVLTELEPLSPQEQRVLRLIVAELSYPEIARELTVSVNTEGISQLRSPPMYELKHVWASE